MSKQDFILLLYKQLRGETLAADEKTALQNWLEAAPQNRQTEAQLIALWQNTLSPIQEVPVHELQEALQTLKANIAAQNKPALSSRHAPKKLWWAVAAAFLLALGAFGLWKTNSPSNAPWVMVEVPAGNRQQVLFPDGSTAQVNGGSKLRYPAVFSAGKRIVELEGEAYFQVTHRAEQVFQVNVADATITVLGTRFNVRAFPTEVKNEVSLFSGKVRVASESQVLELSPGQAAIVDRQSKALELLSAPPAAAEWFKGSLTFRQEQLATAMQELSKYFGKPIAIVEPDMQHCRWTANFPKAELWAVLKNLETTYGFRIEENTDSIRLNGGKCMDK